jgi:hypothetical protein
MNPVPRRETPLAIAALVLWVLTAGAGLILFISGSAAKRSGDEQAPEHQREQAPEQAVPAPASAVTLPPAQTPAVRPAVPSRAPGPGARRAEPPPIPRVKVHGKPGEHPLLEFSHPALGLIGMGLWFVYVGTRHAPLAWASFGILVAAIAAGLSWLARNWLATRHGDRRAGAGFPPRLILLHGLTATATFALAVLTALAASHI